MPSSAFFRLRSRYSVIILKLFTKATRNVIMGLDNPSLLHIFGEDTFAQQGEGPLQILTDMGSILLTNRNFRLSTCIDSARAWANGNKTEIDTSGYASKQWGKLVSSYYVPRWRMFIEYLKSTSQVAAARSGA
ncbi:hypothetical protein PENNAL_c0009G10059 [Penicillium nalgiovense]|uniref:Alpha-N-acetylglucosaminidase C-terminal domain-containing protein n=1 Tax=Penicillium nalgiovense TaxID=60175 RepID=A0A1V6YVY8_PENNA|nr:hypothetical protein PENNAL_c0009G10059 [Penicillium nalgiovense]